MVQELNLPYKFPGLNEYTNANRTNKYSGGSMKHRYTALVANEAKAQGLHAITQPLSLAFEWVEPTSRRDPDNVVFAKKFILDGLVIAGIIPNDTQAYVKSFTDKWRVEKGKQGVLVTLVEGI